MQLRGFLTDRVFVLGNPFVLGKKKYAQILWICLCHPWLRMSRRAVVGWILVDLGVRFPGDKYSAIANSVSAHDPMVAAGNMTVLLGMIFILELIGGAAVFGAVQGSGRAPGKFASKRT